MRWTCHHRWWPMTSGSSHRIPFAQFFSLAMYVIMSGIWPYKIWTLLASLDYLDWPLSLDVMTLLTFHLKQDLHWFESSHKTPSGPLQLESMSQVCVAHTQLSLYKRTPLENCRLSKLSPQLASELHRRDISIQMSTKNCTITEQKMLVQDGASLPSCDMLLQKGGLRVSYPFRPSACL